MPYQAASRALQALANPAKAPVARGIFKNSSNDVFLGVATPQQRRMALEYQELRFRNLSSRRRFRSSTDGNEAGHDQGGNCCDDHPDKESLVAQPRLDVATHCAKYDES